MSMPEIIDLGSLTWTSGFSAQKQLRLGGIPDGIGDKLYKVSRILLDVRYDITTGVGDASSAADMLQYITAALKVAGKNFLNSVTLYDVWLVLADQYMRGSPPLPAAVGASSTNAIRHVKIEVPFVRDDMPEPMDFAPLALALNERELRVTPGGSTVGTGAINSLTVRAYAELRQSIDPKMVAIPIIERFSNDLHEELPAGVYTQLMLMPPSGGFSAASDITDVAVRAGDADVWDHVDPEVVINSYLFGRGLDSSQIGSIESWEAGFASVPFLPLVFMRRSQNGVASQVDTGRSRMAYEISGGLSECDWLMRRYESVDGEAVKKQAGAIGITSPGALVGRVDTANGKPASAAIAAGKTGIHVLPTTISGLASPTAKVPSRIASALVLKSNANKASESSKSAGMSTLFKR